MSAKKRAIGEKPLAGFDGVPPTPEGYYAGHKPNPHLASILAGVGSKYDPQKDQYNADAFSEPISATKNTAIYNMHTYWSKKPHDAIEQYILHYTAPGDVVLDPFCGSGGTALAALMHGRNAAAVDLSPAATFVAANYVRPIPTRDLEAAWESLLRAFANTEVSALFQTICHETGKPATILRTVYSSRFRCSRCLKPVPLFDCPEMEVTKKDGTTKETTVCPNCLAHGIREEVSATDEWIDRMPVATEYRVGSAKKKFRRYNDEDKRARQCFEKQDLALIERADSLTIKNWYPQRYMLDVESDEEVPWGLLWRPYHHGMRKVEHFFTKRNLNIVSTLFSLIPQVSSDSSIQQSLRFAITGILPGLTFLNRYRPDVSFPLNYSANTLYVPPVGTEENPIPHLANKIKRIVDGYAAFVAQPAWGKVVVSTQDACDLSSIPRDSIDYIFTDPPYGYRIQYGELNFLWESWLNAPGDWRKREIIINESVCRGLSFAHWTEMFQQAMAECFRVLKPGRWLSLCFHDSSTEVWQAVQDCMAEAGFVGDNLASVVAIETDYQTHKQIVADQIAKRDLVMNFRKPRPGDWMITQVFIPANADVPTFRDLGSQIIREFLTAHPGSTKDRVYDELVSRTVRKGQLEAHDFDALLRSVAEEVQQPVKQDLFENKQPDLLGRHITSRWYLKDSADQLDRAEQEKEEAAAERIEGFVRQHLKENPEDDGVHYSDLFEQYLRFGDKPRRLLLDWLPEYFFKTTDGTWRPPADEQERQQKAALREAGTLRRMKRFANALIDGVPVREQDRPANDRTLAEWMRQCRRAGLYEQGRALYEKGGINLENLTDEEQIAVEDDYRICAKRKGEDESKTKRQRRKRDDEE